MDMSVKAGRWGWRRVLPALCVLAIFAQLGPLTQAQEPPRRYADLTLDKTDRVDPVNVGDVIQYDLRFRNRGPDDAYGVRIVDHLPAQVEYQSSTASHNGTCSLAGSTLTCAGFQRLPDDASQGIVHVNALAKTAGSPLNTAEIFTDSIDYDSRNNGGSETTTIRPPPSADLVATKSGPAEVTDEDTFVYSIRSHNNGPNTAQNVQLTDELPSGVEFVSASSGCGESGGTVTCSTASLASGANLDGSITVRAKTVGTVTNQASTSSDTADSNSGNNTSAVVSTQIKEIYVPKADLSVTKDGPDDVNNGDNFTYSLVATNAGPDTAVGASVSDLLPSNVQFVSSPDCSHSSGTVTCSLGNMAPGSQNLSITVNAVAPGTATNTASIASSTADPVDDNTSGSVVTEIAPTADVSVSKSGPAGATVGDNFNYSLSVSNSGPDAANGVSISDTLPAGIELVDDGDCSSSGSTITCSPAGGTLAKDASAPFTITVRATQSGSKTNTATVSPSTNDPDSSDHSSSTTINVVPTSADLSLNKSGPADAETGDSITYTLDVANAGPDAAEAVTVSDTLPVSMVFESSDDCTHLGGTVTCVLGTIADGGSDSASFKATANPPAGTQSGNVVNSATVTSSTGDPNSGNNGDSTTTVVSDPPPPPEAGVSISIDDSADPVTEGDSFSYEISIANAGPDEAQNISLSDTLPSGVTAGTLPDECSSAGDEITCDLGSLAANASPLEVTIPVVADSAGTKTNEAEVSWNAPGGSTETASASEATNVEEEQVVAPPPSPEQPKTEENLDGCPTAAHYPTGNPSDGLLAFVPAAIQLERQRRKRLTLVDDKPGQKKSKRSRSKVVKIVAVIAVLAVAATVGILLLTGGNNGKNYATLGGLEGRVDLQKTGDAYEPARKAATLDIGDKVRTGDDGLARIDYTDGSLTRLDHNTTFQVQELVNDATHKSIRTKLDVGRVWHRVEKLTKPGDRFEVKTVTAVATVHGTTFVNDCRFQGGAECSHITLFGNVGVETEAGDQSIVSGGQCKTEEGDDIGPCRFTTEELENDPFLIAAAKLDSLEKGDEIVLPDIFGGKKAALVPVEDNTEVEATEATPTTTTPEEKEETGCPTGGSRPSGTSLPLAAGIVLMMIFFGIAWARPNRKPDTTGDSAN